MEKNKHYIIFWLGQSVSQLGSAMTAFALTIWAYQRTQSAMTVSLMTFCSYVPYILVSIFVGGFIDRHSKKMILIISDSVAALLTVGVFIQITRNNLSIEQIYVVNAIIGFANAFQSPAASVVTGTLIPDGQYKKASGLQSFSSNLTMVVSPMLAGMITGFAGLPFVLVADLLSFLFCIVTLVTIKTDPLISNDEVKKNNNKKSGNLKDSILFLKNEKGLLYIMISLAIINFFSRLTYENILSPMILSRSGNDIKALSVVSGVLGAGGIIGGIMVLGGRGKSNPLKLLYVSAGLSFLFGDLTMGVGQNLSVWLLAGIAASVPIPFVMAGQTMILYKFIPQNMQGSIFALRNAIHSSTIPLGILLGGYLADYVFEPFMESDHLIADLLKNVVGSGAGSGMAVMFLCTGILGSISCIVGYKNNHIRRLADRLEVDGEMGSHTL
ncbi:MFS transporter [Lacrimispora sp.]|jgi:MFS family permease|uniref:MFS transporter n=1 Tax=Lacrimispora sp. TaxID=2719234 RepID=UPI0028AE8163|nr:MFS transporter [Lacrimispora sp.]